MSSSKYIFLLLIVMFSNSVTVEAQSEWELKYNALKKRYALLNSKLIELNSALNSSTVKKEELELKLSAVSRMITVISDSNKPINTYEEQYIAEKNKNKKLSNENDDLKLNVRSLKNKKAELESLLTIEVQKVKKLEYEKQQLETEMAAMEITIDDLEVANSVLNKAKRNLESHVSKLQRDSTQKETTIANQEHTIEVKETIIVKKEARIDLLETKNKTQALTINQQEAKIQFMYNENAIKKLHFQSMYLGVNYRISNFFNPYEKSPDLVKDYQSNISFSLYSAPFGAYFSLPLSYNDRMPSFQDSDPQYYTIQDVESVKMQLDIKGGSYTDIQYNSTEANFKSYNLGIYLAPIKFTYLIFGATQIKGSTWDLYTGDYSQTGEFGIPSLTKTDDDFYVLNYTDISKIKPVVGVAGVFPIRLHKDKRKPNTKIKSPSVSKYNYNVGFQFEFGYNWAYENFFLNTGIHAKLGNVNSESRTIRVGIKNAKKQIINAKRDYNGGLLDLKVADNLIEGGDSIIDESSIESCKEYNDLCRGRDRVLKGEKLKGKALKEMINAKEQEVYAKSTIGKLLLQESVIARIGEDKDYKKKEDEGNKLLEEVEQVKNELESLKNQLEQLENNPTVYDESECYKKGLFGKRKRKRCNDFNIEKDEK